MKPNQVMVTFLCEPEMVLQMKILMEKHLVNRTELLRSLVYMAAKELLRAGEHRLEPSPYRSRASSSPDFGERMMIKYGVGMNGGYGYVKVDENGIEIDQ